MKVLRILGGVLGVLLVVVAAAYALRTNPVGPVAGRGLTGEAAAYPPDWSFSDAHMTIAVEVRPDDPHSITTICFVHEGALYVPAQGGSDKQWTHIVSEDPRVRLKIGERIYSARADRVPDLDFDEFAASAQQKYSALADANEPPPDVWLFRIGPREG